MQKILLNFFKDFNYLILCGANEPVAFFAYPGVPSKLLPSSCQVASLTNENQNITQALEELAAFVKAPKDYSTQELIRYSIPSGPINLEGVAKAISNHLPEHAIFSVDASSSTFVLDNFIGTSVPHDWLFAPIGGSIGQGIPLGVGAGVACPDRKVIVLEGDGSGMYTIQGLWTAAREKLDMTTIIFCNRRYAILDVELVRVYAQDKKEHASNKAKGARAESQLSLAPPRIDYVKVAQGLGLEASRANTNEEFASIFQSYMKKSGPKLIEVSL